MVRLAQRFATVAVISGRPVAFLDEVLRHPAGVRLVGLYGLEWMDADGHRAVVPEAVPWEEVIADVAAPATESAPPGVYVEPKGLTVTLHWRHAPGPAGLDRGVRPGPGRGSWAWWSHCSGLSLELGPPLQVDKGTVATGTGGGSDRGGGLRRRLGRPAGVPGPGAAGLEGVSVARVAVAHAESPPEVAAEADVVVGSAAEAVALLQLLLRAAAS